MENRPKLELEINQPTHIKLLFDEPIVGESQYGKYFLYAVSNGNGNEYSLFAHDSVHDALKSCPKGTEAIITKLAAQRGKKLVTTFDVQIVAENGKSNGKTNSMPSQHDHEESYLNAMQRCFEEADIIRQRFGAIDISKIAVTLYISKMKSNNMFTNFEG